MANPYVPTNFRAEEYFSNHVTVAWDFPAPGLTPNYTFRLYTSTVSGGPFTGPVMETPRLSADLQDPYGLTNFYVTVSSVSRDTGEESAQTVPIFISIDHTAEGVGGAIAKSGTGIPKHLKTNEVGQIELAPGTLSITTGVPFNNFWFTPVPLAPATPTLAASLHIVGPESGYLTGLYVTGQGRCVIELTRAGILVWKGRTNDVDTDLNPVFPEGPIIAAPGQIFELYISNDNLTPLDFSGNLFGFRK